MIVEELGHLLYVNPTPLFIEMLADYRIFIDENQSYQRWKDIDGKKRKRHSVKVSKHAMIESYAYFPVGDVLCSMGAFSYSNSPLHIDFAAGRYCSIARGFALPETDHPHWTISTSPAFYAKRSPSLKAAKEDLRYSINRRTIPARQKDFPTLGHDVWLTTNVALGRGIHVGTGAVVLRGAYVSRSVPPYNFYGGLPARFMKMRFSQDICERLFATNWWLYSPADLSRMPTYDPALFVEEWEKQNYNLSVWSPRKLNIYNELKSH